MGFEGTLAAIVVGLVAGWMAQFVMSGGGYGVFGDVLLGIGEAASPGGSSICSEWPLTLDGSSRSPWPSWEQSRSSSPSACSFNRASEAARLNASRGVDQGPTTKVQ